MNALAPPFPSNPAVGEFYGNWVWNGVRWVCSPAAGVRVVIQTFLASGPYMPSPGLVTAMVECTGGGAGGQAAASDSVTAIIRGGGGGSGGYSRIALAASLVAGGVNVTIGAGGAASATSGWGGAGGATSFGALCVANGAPGGVMGAAAGTGDVAMPGATAEAQMQQYVPSPIAIGVGGLIGASLFGGNGGGGDVAGGQAGNGGSAAANSGAGGQGGVANQIAAGNSGSSGAGGSGLCVVTEYCWSDTGTEDCLNPPINVNARVAVTHVPWTGPGPCPPGWGAQQALGFDEGD